MRKQKGFTVIEVLIVLAIFAIILALILPIIFPSSSPSTPQVSTYDWGVRVSIVKVDNHDYVISSKGGIVHSASCSNKQEKQQ